MATKRDQVDLVQYDERRRAIAKRFTDRPYGSQTAAAFDTRTAPTLVSSILGGKYINSDVLTKLEGWLNAQEQGPQDPTGPGVQKETAAA